MPDAPEIRPADAAPIDCLGIADKQQKVRRAATIDGYRFMYIHISLAHNVIIRGVSKRRRSKIAGSRLARTNFLKASQL